MPAEDKRDRRAPARLILLMRGLRQFSYGLLAVILGVVLTEEGFSPASIGVLITVSLVGDMAGTYPIGLFADSWGRRRTLALLMAATGAVFGLVSSYAVLLVAAFFGTLGTTASETAPFLPIDQAMLAQVTLPERRTGQFARYNLVASLSTAPGALAAGLPALLASVGLPLASGIRLLFGLYALLGLVVASFSLRLSASVEAPGHPPVEARRLGHRLAPPLHRSRGIIWRLTALFSVDALAGGLVEPDERTAAASVTSSRTASVRPPARSSPACCSRAPCSCWGCRSSWQGAQSRLRPHAVVHLPKGAREGGTPLMETAMQMKTCAMRPAGNPCSPIAVKPRPTGPWPAHRTAPAWSRVR